MLIRFSGTRNVAELIRVSTMADSFRLVHDYRFRCNDFESNGTVGRSKGEGVDVCKYERRGDLEDRLFLRNKVEFVTAATKRIPMAEIRDEALEVVCGGTSERQGFSG